MKMETLKRQILTAKGDVRAELVLKNARVINVFTNEIEQADVAICQGIILGVGHYTGETELDLQGKYVCPGLVDGHIHIESSMLCGPPPGWTSPARCWKQSSCAPITSSPGCWVWRS